MAAALDDAGPSSIPMDIQSRNPGKSAKFLAARVNFECRRVSGPTAAVT